MTTSNAEGAGLAALHQEMARQNGDAIASFAAATDLAAQIAASIRRTGRLLLLGMGASHGLGRAVQPIYRQLGIDAVALPLSEQLDQPLPLAGRTILVTSQSGKSAEAVRWLQETAPDSDAFGLTMDRASSLAQALPSLIGVGGVEKAFAATRSATVTLALQAAVLDALGADAAPMLRILGMTGQPDVRRAVAALSQVRTVVTSGRRLCGLAEVLALGMTELSRLPCHALESGQFRHGPMEMLGPLVGVVLLRAADPDADLVRGLAEGCVEAGSPVVMLDASGQAPVAGTVTIAVEEAADLAALAALLPVAQRLMIGFAAGRVADVGTPVRSQKVTSTE